MRNLAIFAIGALALILVGCATLREGADCATLRRVHQVADQLLNGRCPIPQQQDAPPPRPEPDTRPQ